MRLFICLISILFIICVYTIGYMRLREHLKDNVVLRSSKKPEVYMDYEVKTDVGKNDTIWICRIKIPN